MVHDFREYLQFNSGFLKKSQLVYPGLLQNLDIFPLIGYHHTIQIVGGVTCYLWIFLTNDNTLTFIYELLCDLKANSSSTDNYYFQENLLQSINAECQTII